MDGNFSNKIFLSDEARFKLGGYNNKQNCRIWDSENPQVIEDRPLHAEKPLFMFAFWFIGLIRGDSAQCVSKHGRKLR